MSQMSWKNRQDTTWKNIGNIRRVSVSYSNVSNFSSDLSPTDPVQNMFNINRDKSLFNKSNATNTGYEELDFRDVKP